MTPKLSRLAYAFEFLVAIIAIFTAWSEIGGQAALDLMHWGWKLGLSLALAGAIVAYTAALVADDTAWTMRSLRWLVAIIVFSVVIGVVTYYYTLQEDTTNGSDDSGTVSISSPFSAPSGTSL